MDYTDVFKPKNIKSGKRINARWKGRNLIDDNGKVIMQAPSLLDAVEGINNFMPITGDIQAGVYAADDVKKGNYGSAALNSLGLLPFVPALGGVVGKANKKLTKFEEAHQTAQKNATEMLNLPPNNTAMDRAKAMGFDGGWYHGRYKDYDQINPERTFYTTKDADYASQYSYEPTASSMGGKSMSDFDDLRPNVMPLMIKKNEILDTRTRAGQGVFKDDFYMQYGNGTPLTEKGLPDWVDAEDFGEMFSDLNREYKGVYADEGKIPTWDGGLKDRGVSAAIFEPSAVRSRFAAFDPARRHEADILGQADVGLLSGLGLGSLLGLGVNKYGGNE